MGWLEIFPRIILWVIVPLIMVLLLVYSAVLAKDVDNGKIRSSAVAGFWAGIVLALIYIISQLNNVIIPDFAIGFSIEFNIVAIISGAISGFVLLAIAGLFSQSPAIGLLALVLAATSISALFSYFFLPGYRDGVMYIALGMAFGALLYRVFAPMIEALNTQNRS